MVHLKTAWIVLDGGKLTDILTARKTFEEVVEYAKDLYRATRMSFVEKALIAHYNSGTTVHETVFSSVPIETHFTSALYRQLQKFEEDIAEIGGLSHQLLSRRFAEGPQYVIVGTEPAVEIRRVTNLEVATESEGDARVVWHEPTERGTSERKLWNSKS
jgi:hypothetical protein